MIRQVSVFIQNREGRLSEMLKVFKSKDINIRSLTIAETADYGVVRLILQNTDKGLEALKEAHIMANETDVMAVEIADRPGGMSDMVELLTDAGINIEYAYSFLPKNTSNAIIIFKIDADDVNKVKEVFSQEAHVNLLEGDELLMK